ncbi:hypothetical protein [Sphingomonas kyeonggiensis]|uniref:hypothetical protein n=1 Tax=Sphingomonas kyeonggiensis TaxID=1268553 RepID=UPI0021AA763B|nr:hypothetical protein [Sphingomonas kyeonggiensis]
MPPLEFLGDLALLIPELRRERRINLVLDAAIEIVHVDLPETLAKAFPLPGEPRHRRVVIGTHFREALPERVPQPLEHLRRKRHTVQHVADLVEQHLLSDIGLGAFPLRVAAAVVDVFLLLDVADERTATMAAANHAGE